MPWVWRNPRTVARGNTLGRQPTPGSLYLGLRIPAPRFHGDKLRRNDMVRDNFMGQVVLPQKDDTH